MDITTILETVEKAIDWLGDKVSAKTKKDLEARLKALAEDVREKVKAETDALDAGTAADSAGEVSDEEQG